jgi:hypothetical protein
MLAFVVSLMVYRKSYVPLLSGDSLCLQPVLPTDLAAEPAPAPTPLPEGCQVQGAALRPQLYVSGGGECGAGGAQLISGCGGGSPCQGMLLMLF